MECPECKAMWMYVAEARPQPKEVARRRCCPECGAEFWTVERMREEWEALQQRQETARRAVEVAEIGARFRADVLELVKGS